MEPINKKLDRFYLYKSDFRSLYDNDIGLYTGNSGLILYQGIRQMAEKKSNTYLDENIHDVFKHLKSTSNISPTFASGISGFCWTLNVLKEFEVIDISSSAFTQTDNYLEQCLDYYLRVNDMDILHGALGIGIYFLKAKNFKYIYKIIEVIR